jgi:hypothetical protein
LQGSTGRWHCERFGTGDGRYGACAKRVANRWISFDPLGRR